MRAELINRKTKELVYYYDTEEKKPTFINEAVHKRICKTGLNTLFLKELNESSYVSKNHLPNVVKPDHQEFHSVFNQSLLMQNKPSQFSLNFFEWKYID